MQLPLTGRRTVSYWTEEGHDRVELLGRVIAYLAEHRWGKVLDSGWSDWDLEIYCHPETIVRVCTAQEDYGGNKRQIRVRYRLRPSGSMRAIGIAAVLSAAIAIGSRSWPVALGALALLAVDTGLWWYGAHRASQVIAIIDTLASRMRAVPYDPGRGQGERAKVHWWKRKKVDVARESV